MFVALIFINTNVMSIMYVNEFHFKKASHAKFLDTSHSAPPVILPRSDPNLNEKVSPETLRKDFPKINKKGLESLLEQTNKIPTVDKNGKSINKGLLDNMIPKGVLEDSLEEIDKPPKLGEIGRQKGSRNIEPLKEKLTKKGIEEQSGSSTPPIF